MALTSVDIATFIEPFNKKPYIFKGVFACDNLPKSFTLPAAFVINLSRHDSRGSHWIGLFISENRIAQYFDSFGFQPMQKDIVLFIRINSHRLEYNKKQIQHISSVKCGKFVIFLILLKMFDKDVRMVLDKFSCNLTVNEIIIENIFNYFKQKRVDFMINSRMKNIL